MGKQINSQIMDGELNTTQRDYVSIAIGYAKAAVKDRGHKKHGRYLRLAAKRFLNDLKRSKKKTCSFTFENWWANDVCDFIEKLPHIEGTWETTTIVLHPSHVFFLVQLFGFRDKQTGARRFTSALFAVARKNAKSTLAAAILLYCMACEDESGAQLISAATTFDQASIIFRIAKAMIDRTPDLRDAFGLETWAKAITRNEIGASFKPLHAKASTQDGLNPSHTSLDEIHAHKTADLLNVLSSAAGARLNPLWLYTTTEGYSNPGPWQEIRRFAKQLLEGVFGNEADHFLVVYYAIDEEDKEQGIKEDDEFDKNKWIKANPLLDVNPLLKKAIERDAIEARQMPSKLAEFRIKRLNRESSTSKGWVNLVSWGQCGGPVDLDFLKEYECYGGLDLSETRDLTSFRLVWKIEDILYTRGWRFCPTEAVKYRTERGTVPYASWVEAGHLIQTEGASVDYRVIGEKIKEVCEKFNVVEIGFDRFNATSLTNELLEDEIPLVEYIQGPKSYNPAIQALEVAYIDGRLCHANDPVLKWCASNVILRMDANLNKAPDKKNSADKIDDMCALLMAVGRLVAGDGGGLSFWESRKK